MTDETLMTRVAQGDHAAFEELYRRYWRLLMWYACRYVAHEEAEEIVQDVFTYSIWRNADKYDPKRVSFKTWCRACLRRRILFEFRKWKSLHKHQILRFAAPIKTRRFADPNEAIDGRLHIDDVLQKIRPELTSEEYDTLIDLMEGHGYDLSTNWKETRWVRKNLRAKMRKILPRFGIIGRVKSRKTYVENDDKS